ncbi:hypothetical protein HDU82_005696 [Entophlyctis luteolus]|nr:hypothetical protein HDU82_005696 [Entophlyctis luteolus]
MDSSSGRVAQSSSTPSDPSHALGWRLANRFRVQDTIGHGSFGVVYEGVDEVTGAVVALKVESECPAPSLKNEREVYRLLENNRKHQLLPNTPALRLTAVTFASAGFPKIHFFEQTAAETVLAMDLLGQTLEDILDDAGRALATKDVSMLAKRMVTARLLLLRVQVSDANLSRFRTACPAADVFLVDFGMAKHFRHRASGKHIACKARLPVRGTARYMSVNAHCGRELSRRDDLEQLGYVLVYLAKGSLPWERVQEADARQTYNKVAEVKRAVSIGSLCDGLPPQFAEYLQYCRDLEFAQTPDYAYLARLFDAGEWVTVGCDGGRPSCVQFSPA